MAKVLEVIKLRDVIRVTNITRFVPGFPAGMIVAEFIGEDFTSVDSVFINDVQAPQFFIINATTLWAQIPSGVQGIQRVTVLSANFTRTAAGSLMLFQVGTKTRAVEGIIKLTQLFTKWMLQSPGSDLFNPERGGGIQDLLGVTGSTDNINPILGAITRGIDKTANEIRQAQLNAPRLPLAERLLAATLVDVNIAREQMEAQAKVRIDSVAGQSAISALGL